MLQIKKNLEEKSDFGENQSSNDEQTSIFNSPVNRNDGDGSLEKATAKGNYAYWLNQEDITDIARLQYNNYKRIGVSAEFEVLGSTSQLAHLIEKFKLKTQHLEVARLTLIINLANLHWVTLIISHGNEGYVSYYIDSKDNAPPTEYYALLNSLGISLISLKMDVSQQTDAYNCGLWALENAFTLNEMLDENWSLHQVINELKVPRNSEYFNNKRLFLSAKLRADAERNARWLHTVGSEQGDHLTSDSEPMLKRQRAETKEEKTRLLLEVFVEAFISAFMKRLAAYHLAAKGERLTDTTLKIELKTGLTGALLGVGISQSIVGS
ncbi:MAG: hypothetical protein AAGB33_00235, partial [Cellulomonas sp.]|nr:hypothetical protein [Rickettsiella sp.]